MIGKYVVNNVFYEDKISAILDASKTGADISWAWNCPGYDNLDWTVDDNWSLRSQYRARAQQLRDSYNWLTLSYSGGADSWNVLNSFLSNKIHLDEILCRWPIRATEEKYTPNKHNLSSLNHVSEWDFCIKPDLAWIASAHPEIKITLHDWSNDLMNTYDDSYVLRSRGDLLPGHTNRWDIFTDSERRLLDLGKKSCLIVGSEKPQIAAKGSKIYCYFLDHLANTHTHTNDDLERKTEPFYWTDDMPTITKTQARLIFRALQENPDMVELIQWGSSYSPQRKDIWNQFVKKIIYPEYDHTRFQSNKYTGTIEDFLNPETDKIEDFEWAWLMSGKINNRLSQSWRFHTQSLIDSIGPKYLSYRDQKINGLMNFVSEFYFVGDITQK